jgi:hypothetical protein
VAAITDNAAQTLIESAVETVVRQQDRRDELSSACEVCFMDDTDPMMRANQEVRQRMIPKGKSRGQSRPTTARFSRST